MDNAADFGRLLRKTLAALLVCAALVVLCFWFVDRPVAFYVHDHRIADHSVLKWLTYPPPILQAWVPAVLAALMVRRAWGPWQFSERVVLAACVSLVLANQFRLSLAFVFGRYWPETWIDDNPSLIGDESYGFHPFHAGSAYASFPSGHAARTLAVAAVVWIAYPRWRWACVLASLATAVGLLGMDYHFVGDVIAGGFVGAIVGAYTSRYTRLAGPQPARSAAPGVQPGGPAGGSPAS
jgi:membrane-associated phospholipid phosphatase